MKPRKKRTQHWVPRFYLNNFVDPTAPQPDPYVWVADVESGCVRRKATKHVACSPYAYHVDEVDAEGFSLENLFMKIEGASAPHIRRLAEANPVSLSLQGRFHLSLFLAHQFTRTPRYWSVAETAIQRRAEVRVQRLLTDDEFLESLWTQRGFAGMIDHQTVRAAIQRMTFTPTRAGIAGVSLTTADALAQIFWEMRWSRLVTDDGEFCTTDNPVALLTPDAQPRDPLDPELLIAFPISPRVLLVLDNRTEEVRDDPLDGAEVDRIISGILPTAERSVFCASRARAEWAIAEVREGRVQRGSSSHDGG